MRDILFHVRALISAVMNRYSKEELDAIGKPNGAAFFTLGESVAALHRWMDRIESVDRTMTKGKLK